jgi:aspartate aminotransferase
MKRAFKERRDLIVSLLNKIKGVTCRVPGGAFYVFPDFSYYLGMHSEEKLLKDTFDISEYILDCAKVVTVPGDGFGSPGHIRFSYATSTQIIKKGIGKVESALKKLKSKE